MTLPAPNLDDLRFQRDLVDEARKRITNYCPEWTEYNLSDPGITLIELFSWMTELMVYRLNKVPDKNYVKFLEMLGLQRLPASSSRTELTFWLSTAIPLTPSNPQTILIPEGLEVKSEMTNEEVIFTTDRSLEIVPPLLLHVRTDPKFNHNHYSRLGLETFYPFDQDTPKEGDTFYLGFDPANNISGHLLQIAFDCDPTEAVGIRRDDPPWVWECLIGDGIWQEVKPSQFEGEKDTTGGLNNEVGSLVLYLPLSLKANSLYGLNALWIRCRIEQRNPIQGMYSESPKVKNIQTFTIGATTIAMHSVFVKEESLGVSTGEPGQTFKLVHSPILNFVSGETVEVEEIRSGEKIFVPWDQVSDFSRSTRFDRHFVLDNASGTVKFGPSIRQSDGTISQYGKVPSNGKEVRVTRYRHGGGINGNLPSGALTSISVPLAYISRASNLIRAVGGRDQETLDELKLRAQRELQAQRRAVTSQDYEQFTLSYSRSIARAKCITPGRSADGTSGIVTVLVVPAVSESLISGNLVSLHLQDSLTIDIRNYLDQYRLLTTALQIREPHYVGVKVKARIIPQEFVQTAEVEQRVREELQRYLTPLPIDDQIPSFQSGERWEGWQFGRDLYKAEVIALIQQVPSVKYVLDVEVFSRTITPVEEKPFYDDITPLPVNQVDKVLQIPDDTLICSLDHEIEIVSIADIYQKG